MRFSRTGGELHRELHQSGLLPPLTQILQIQIQIQVQMQIQIQTQMQILI